MRRMKVESITLCLLSLTLGAGVVQAQERVDSTVNQFSARPIGDEDIMMKRTLWRRVDLNEKQNISMFSKNNEITKYLLDAAKAGLIEAFPNDSCVTPLTEAELHKRMVIPNQVGGFSEEELAAGFGAPASTDVWGDTKAEPAKKESAADDGWGAPVKKEEVVEDDGWGPPKKKTTKKTAPKTEVAKVEPAKDTTAFDSFKTDVVATEEEYFPQQLSVLEIKEDWTFDKKRSRLYNDIQTLTIFLPSDQNTATGLELPVASFKYKDVDRLFRSDPKKYIWYNTHNTAKNMNLADAMDLRLFYGRIIKYSNANDRSFLDIYNGDKQALIKSLNYEQELMELEHGLWEY